MKNVRIIFFVMAVLAMFATSCETGDETGTTTSSNPGTLTVRCVLTGNPPKSWSKVTVSIVNYMSGSILKSGTPSTSGSITFTKVPVGDYVVKAEGEVSRTTNGYTETWTAFGSNSSVTINSDKTTSVSVYLD
jgi:hypothetical protein